MQKPFFSIVVVSLNPGERLKNTLDSIWKQTYTNYEVILKDGGSADGSLQALCDAGYFKNKNQIKIIQKKDVSIYDGIGELLEAPFATFDRCLAEEMALAFAEEKLYEDWFKMVHINPNCNCGFVSMIYKAKLSDVNVFVKELKWRE